MQSPISLKEHSAYKISYPSPVMNKHHNRPVKMRVENDGLGLDIKINSDMKMMLSSGGENYTLDHVHFHWPAEHIINNRR